MYDFWVSCVFISEYWCKTLINNNYQCFGKILLTQNKDYICFSVRFQVYDIVVVKILFVKMSIYTTAEKVQIVKWVYSGESYRNTAALFSALFEHPPIPSHTTIRRIVQRFEATGSVNTQPRQVAEEHDHEADEIGILAAVNANPNDSVRQIGAGTLA